LRLSRAARARRDALPGGLSASAVLRAFRRELSFLLPASGLWFIDDICFDLLTMTLNMVGDLTDPRKVR
jgi:hypothetical protein